jgi:hypothetical protein
MLLREELAMTLLGWCRKDFGMDCVLYLYNVCTCVYAERHNTLQEEYARQKVMVANMI